MVWIEITFRKPEILVASSWFFQSNQMPQIEVQL